MAGGTTEPLGVCLCAAGEDISFPVSRIDYSEIPQSSKILIDTSGAFRHAGKKDGWKRLKRR
jgi:hypothetical protein